MNPDVVRRVRLTRLVWSATLAALIGGTLPACAPLVVGGAVFGGAMMVVDRRTSGAQVEDQAIELKGLARAREASADAHVNITSYNRMVLITGEVPREADRGAIEQAVSRIENVRSVVNELAVMESSSIAQRTNDSFISSKVKAAFVDAKDLQAQAGKVVTERGVVYLMGRVTEREANRFSDVARTVNGVRKVVRVFETITEAELADLQPKQ